MSTLPGVLAYLGPETVLPITSVVATVVGFVLMFWRSGVRLLFRFVERPARPVASRRLPSPHFAFQPTGHAVGHATETGTGDSSGTDDA